MLRVVAVASGNFPETACYLQRLSAACSSLVGFQLHFTTAAWQQSLTWQSIMT